MKLILIVLIALLLGCSSTGSTSKVSEKSLLIQNGDSKERIIEIFGEIGSRSFSGNREAWQYCSTGFNSDIYVIVWFTNGSVTGVTKRNGYGNGLCSEHFFNIDWS
ncbi:hypothetical protein N8985_04465 [Glaciecola sp.]|nr:hypothetical protein [Glaciecola sp.]